MATDPLPVPIDLPGLTRRALERSIGVITRQREADIAAAAQVWATLIELPDDDLIEAVIGLDASTRAALLVAAARHAREH